MVRDGSSSSSGGAGGSEYASPAAGPEATFSVRRGRVAFAGWGAPAPDEALATDLSFRWEFGRTLPGGRVFLFTITATAEGIGWFRTSVPADNVIGAPTHILIVQI